MATRRNVLGSLITTKLIIGVTGILLFLYLILHIAGNVIVFFGRRRSTRYSHALISNPLVVPVEIGLLVVFLIHLFKAIRMTFHNRQARPAKYASKKWPGGTSQKSIASSSMILTGLALLIFVPIHVVTFKYGTHYDYGNGVRDLYRLEVENFSSLGRRWPLRPGHGVRRPASLARRPELVSIAGPGWSSIHAVHSKSREGVRCRDCRRVHCHYPVGVPGGRSFVTPVLESKIPSGPIAGKWDRRRFENKLVNPANRRKYDVIIVGTGLAGSSAAAALGEQGYRVKLFCILDSPRRAHSIAAQGGINAAKNYRNDGVPDDAREQARWVLLLAEEARDRTQREHKRSLGIAARCGGTYSCRQSGMAIRPWQHTVHVTAGWPLELAWPLRQAQHDHCQTQEASSRRRPLE